MFNHNRRYPLRLSHRIGISAFLFCRLLVWSVFLSSCRSGVHVETPIEVEVRQVGFDPFSNSHVVILQDKNSKKAMPIWVGISEAQAIQLQLQGALPPRPLTHDLLKNILEQVGVEVDKVLVSELKGSTYYARIHLLSGKKTMEVDSRPSDAIALALRFHRPIFVERAVFESSLVSEGPGSEESERKPGQQVSAKFFGMTVQDLTGDLISHFDLPDAQGVLVSEVEGKSGAGRLQRGDVIMAVKGEKVRDIAELRQKLGQEEGHVVTVRVRRDGQDVNVPLSITNTEMSQRKEESE